MKITLDRSWVLLVCLLIMGNSTLSAQQPEDKYFDVFHNVGKIFDVDPLLLMAISKRESGLNPYALNINGEEAHCLSRQEAESALRYVTINPWYVKLSSEEYRNLLKRGTADRKQNCAVTSGGQYRTYFPNYARAKSFLITHQLLDRQPRKMNPESIDVGLMQVNWAAHGHQVKSKHRLFSIGYSIIYAALYLKELGVDKNQWLAVGRYHAGRNGSTDRARRYTTSVRRIYSEYLVKFAS